VTRFFTAYDAGFLAKSLLKPYKAGAALLYIQLALVGLVTGGAYGLESVGLVTIFKGSRVVNLAQGAIGMVGAYVFYDLITAGIPWEAALVGGVLAAALIGLVIYLACISPLGQAALLARIVVSLGAMLVLEGASTLYWGSDLKSVPEFLGNSTYTVVGVNIPESSIAGLVTAAVVTLIGSALFSFTRFGRAIEGASSVPDAARRLGYSPRILGSLSWSAGSALAGLAGILVTPSSGLLQTQLTLMVVPALAGAVLGGFRSLWRAFVGALIIGMIQSVLVGVSSQQGTEQIVPLIAVFLVLLVSGDAIPQFRDLARERQPLVPPSVIRIRTVVVSVVVVGTILAVSDQYWQNLIIQASGIAIVCLSIVLVTGYLGEISFMQWSLAGIGAFLTLYLSTDGLPWLLAIPISVASCGLVGVAIGAPALRVRGVSLAVFTLCASVAIQGGVFPRFNGGQGYVVANPKVLGWTISTLSMAIISVMLVGLVALGLWITRRSAWGQRALAVRSSERAALAVGISIARLKIVGFAMGAVLAGLGGCVWAYGVGAFAETNFDPITSFSMVGFTFLNGVGSVLGGVTAGAAQGLFPNVLTNYLHISGSSWFQVIAGIGLILVTIRHPDGALVRVGDADRSSILRYLWLTRRGAQVSPTDAQPDNHLLEASIASDRNTSVDADDRRGT
jgi:branched-subunit amino acid ABC-type transport system permease component